MSEEKKLPQNTEKTPDKQPEEINIPEIVDSMPEEIRNVVETTSMMFSGRLPNPISKKITPEHISVLIEAATKEDERQFDYAKQGRWFNFIIFLVLIALFVFLIIYLSNSNSELLSEIIKAAIFIAAGFGSGYGYCKSKA